jgi:superfamily II DNA/RNA helicase
LTTTSNNHDLLASNSDFARLGIPASLAARLTALGITTPTPIQEATIELIANERDVIAEAPTGSGKTIAFLAPIIARKLKPGAACKYLVLTPTRELAAQISKVAISLSDKSFRITTIYGGVPYRGQISRLARGTDLLVATPGRLIDLIDSKNVALDQIEVVVLDEVDRMAEIGFLPAVTQLLEMVPPSAQMLFFSATVDSSIESLSKRFQEDPKRIQIKPENATREHVPHSFVRVEHWSKVVKTIEAVRSYGSSMIFCNTRSQVDRLVDELDAQGVKAVGVHGGLSQRQREQALRKFSQGRTSALVATDVAARGIHIDDVSLVIHYDLPMSYADYLHRSGRTGRAGKSGTVIALVSSRDDAKAREYQARHEGRPAGHGQASSSRNRYSGHRRDGRTRRSR